MWRSELVKVSRGINIYEIYLFQIIISYRKQWWKSDLISRIRPDLMSGSGRGIRIECPRTHPCVKQGPNSPPWWSWPREKWLGA